MFLKKIRSRLSFFSGKSTPHITISGKMWIALWVIAFLGPTAYFLTRNPSSAEAGWWNDSWQYRKQITITNNTSVENNVFISFDDTNVLDTSDTNKFQADCGDIRFTDAQGALLPYYINSGCGTTSTDIDVLFNSFPAGENSVYLYYGNPSAEDGFAASSFTSSSGGSTEDWLEGWAKRLEITVSPNNIDNSLTHFPLLLTLGSGVGTASDDITAIFDEIGSNSQKIAVTKDDGITQIYAEIEKWDATNEQAWLWVSKNDLSLSASTNTTLYLYYDSTQPDNSTYVGSANSTVGENVWDSGYVMVQHLEETTTGNSDFLDSTSNSHDSNNVVIDGTGSNADAVGNADGAVQFDGSDDYIEVADSDDFSSSQLTLEAWINLDQTASSKGESMYFLTKDAADAAPWQSYHLAVDSSDDHIVAKIVNAADSSTAWVYGNQTIGTSSWYHVAVSYDGSTVQLFTNGGTDGSSSSLSGGVHNSNYGVYLNGLSPWGSERIDGVMDEIRISNTGRSAAWIKATYHSQTDNLVNWGTEELEPVAEPIATEASNYTIGNVATEEQAPGAAAYWALDEGNDQTAHDSINNHVGQLGTTASADSADPSWQSAAACHTNACLLFDGSDDLVSISNTVNDIKTISLWVKPLSNSEQIIALNGTTSVQLSGNTIITNGISSPTIYVDGAASSTMSANEWHHLEITTASAISGSAVAFGKIGSSYGNIYLDEVSLYPYIRSADQVLVDYTGAAAVFGTSNSGDTGTNVTFGDADVEPSYIVDGAGNGPLVEINFDQAPNQTTQDSSGNNNHGTLGPDTSITTEDPAWTTVTGAPPQSHGLGSGALIFDGSNDYLALPTLNLGTAFTVSAWINPTTLKNYGEIIGDDYEIGLTTWGDGKVAAGIGDDTSWGTILYSDVGAVQADEWSYLTLRYDGSTLDLWINGAQVDAASNSGYNLTVTPYVGYRRESSSTYAFNGSIDRVLFYDYARTPAQIAYDYNRGAPIAHWKFDECQGTTVHDASGLGNNGNIVVGDTSGSNDSVGTCGGTSGSMWADGSQGKFNASLEFDGTNDWIDGVNQPPVQTTPNMFTIAGWIKPNNHTSYFITPNSNGIDQRLAYQGTSERISVDVAESADTNERALVSTTGSVPVGEWTHFAVSINDKNVRIYINGQLDQDYNETINIGGWENNWRIGQRGNNTYWYSGQMDDLRVYNYILSEDQVKSVFNGGAAAAYR